MSSSLPTLSLLETRVLGVLVEKQRAVPDTYPLTLNALTAGCNQKTSRDPVLSATEAEVQLALDRLRSLSLIIESSGGRVMRYAHNIERVLGVLPVGHVHISQSNGDSWFLHRFCHAAIRPWRRCTGLRPRGDL